MGLAAGGGHRATLGQPEASANKGEVTWVPVQALPSEGTSQRLQRRQPQTQTSEAPACANTSLI